MSGRVKISKLARMGEASLTANDVFPVVDAESQITKKVKYENLSNRILSGMDLVKITDAMRFLGQVGKDPTEYGVNRIDGQDYDKEFKVGDVVLFDNSQYILTEIETVYKKDSEGQDTDEISGYINHWDKFNYKVFKNCYVSDIDNVNGRLVVTKTPIYFDDKTLVYRDKTTPVRYKLYGIGTQSTDSSGDVIYNGADAVGEPLEDTTLAPDLVNTTIEFIQEDADSPGYIDPETSTDLKSELIGKDMWKYTGYPIEPKFVVKFGDRELTGARVGSDITGDTVYDFFYEFINNKGTDAVMPNTVATTVAKLKITKVSDDNFKGENVATFSIQDITGDSVTNS